MGSGDESPQRVQGWNPGGGLGAKTQKTTKNCKNDAEIIGLLSVFLLHKTLYNISKGGALAPLAERPCSECNYNQRISLLLLDNNG